MKNQIDRELFFNTLYEIEKNITKIRVGIEKLKEEDIKGIMANIEIILQTNVVFIQQSHDFKEKLADILEKIDAHLTKDNNIGFFK